MIETVKLRAAVSEFLASAGVRETEGPYYSHFMVKRDDGMGHKIVYHAYCLGVAKLGPAYENRTNILGRFKTYEALQAAVIDMLAGEIGASKFVIWRTEPEVELSHGYFKAYLRFAITDCERWFNDAARYHLEQTSSTHEATNAAQSLSLLNVDGV